MTETFYLGCRTATGGKIRTSLTATHRQRGQGILERLLKAQELKDRKVYR